MNTAAESWAPAAPAARILDPRNPLAIARQFVTELYTTETIRTLHAWRDECRIWTGTHYSVMSESAVRAALYEYLDGSVRSDSGESIKPGAALVSNVFDALRAVAHLDDKTNPPTWLSGLHDPPAIELLPLRNGLLHRRSRCLLPHTPALFSTYSIACDYDPAEVVAEEWLGFLMTVWPDDEDAIDTLQEMFGYILSGETRQHKAFLLVGPKRSGKGTIARTLRALIGECNVAGPTLSSLATNFGLQSLVDRPLAIISDARLSGRADAAVIVERLLSVSGEDVLTVDRKHRDPWIGQLGTRFLILTNELPKLADTSGAVASRFVLLTMTQSWYGREDVHLFDRLIGELPAILNWALEGFDRLRKRGHFQIPASSEEAVRDLEALGSPVGAFVKECCIVEPGSETSTDVLYNGWKHWCEEHGRSSVSTEQVFGRDLRAAVPGLSTGDRRAGGARFRVFVGIRLRHGGDT